MTNWFFRTRTPLLPLLLPLQVPATAVPNAGPTLSAFGSAALSFDPLDRHGTTPRPFMRSHGMNMVFFGERA